ncbi:MAG: hypothetical protein ACREE5_14885 [Acetobacteraceae bacterium]
MLRRNDGAAVRFQWPPGRLFAAEHGRTLEWAPDHDFVNGRATAPAGAAVGDLSAFPAPA